MCAVCDMKRVHVRVWMGARDYVCAVWVRVCAHVCMRKTKDMRRNAMGLRRWQETR